MLYGLNRRSLNVIIFVSMVAIVWINLRHSDETSILEPLDLAPLPSQSWQTITTQENVPVRWQTLRSDQLTIAISGEDNYRLHLSVPATNWAVALKDAIPGLPASRPAGIAMQGPLTAGEMTMAAAWLISHLQLHAPGQKTEQSPDQHQELGARQACQTSYPAGAHWWNDRAGAGWATPASPDAAAAGPDNRQWADFRQAATRMLRQDWMSANRIIDIQSELAYHRWPENYLQALYADLGVAQPDSAMLYSACLNSVSGRIEH